MSCRFKLVIDSRGVLYLYAPDVAKDVSVYELQLVARKQRGSCVVESASVNVNIYVVPANALLTSEAYAVQLKSFDRAWETEVKAKEPLHALVRYSTAHNDSLIDADSTPAFEVVGFYLWVHCHCYCYNTFGCVYLLAYSLTYLAKPAISALDGTAFLWRHMSLRITIRFTSIT
jgi:hypothetical protein